jgi:hypothetical protein
MGLHYIQNRDVCDRANNMIPDDTVLFRSDGLYSARRCHSAWRLWNGKQPITDLTQYFG